MAVDPLVSLAERRAVRNGTGTISDLADTRARLEEILGLSDAGIRVRAVSLFGSGAEATLRVDLSTGDELRFEPADSMIRPQVVSGRVAFATGVAVHLKQPQCVEAAALARRLADTAARYTEVDQAIEWGTEFLQGASTLEFDSRNQAERFATFKVLASRDPRAHAREEMTPFAQACLVLRDADGARLVRSGWFLDFVRATAPRVSHKHLPTLMHEAGWQRPKRVKATSPGTSETLIWTFYTVPNGWDDNTEPVNG